MRFTVDVCLSPLSLALSHPPSIPPYLRRSLACLLARSRPRSLPASLPASLRPCVPASLRPCVPTSLRPCLPASLPSSFSFPPSLPLYLPTCLPPSLPPSLSPSPLAPHPPPFPPPPTFPPIHLFPPLHPLSLCSRARESRPLLDHVAFQSQILLVIGKMSLTKGQPDSVLLALISPSIASPSSPRPWPLLPPSITFTCPPPSQPLRAWHAARSRCTPSFISLRPFFLCAILSSFSFLSSSFFISFSHRLFFLWVFFAFFFVSSTPTVTSAFSRLPSANLPSLGSRAHSLAFAHKPHSPPLPASHHQRCMRMYTTA